LHDLLDDNRWHSEAELAEVVRFPDLWVRELLAEETIDVLADLERVQVKLRETARAT
jgi:hypothetical protein